MRATKKMRKKIKKFLPFGMVFVICALTGLAAENSWTGRIGDSLCGAKHDSVEQHKSKMGDRDCTLECVKNKAKYIFISKGKVYEIQNQSFAGLKRVAGQTVKLIGEMGPDGKSVTVSRIASGTSN